MPNKKTLIALVVTIILIIIFSIVLLRHDSQPLASDVEVMKQEEAKKNEETTYKPNLPFVELKDFSVKEQAEKYINEGLGRKTGALDIEHVVLGIVQDSNNPNIVYFSTEGKRTEFVSKTGFQGIYKFNSKTFAWSRLLKNSIVPKLEELHVIGLEDNKLIILLDSSADTEQDTDCDAIKSIDNQEDWKFYALLLTNPGKGLSEITPSENIKKQLQEFKQNCQ